MCIRDSRNTHTFPKGYIDLGDLDPALEGTYKMQLKDGSTAVSYTHLRAHETVLDLVCRLLLEKKNIPHS